MNKRTEYSITECCASCKYGGIKSGYEEHYFLWCHLYSGNTAHAGYCDRYESRPVVCDTPNKNEVYCLHADDGTTKEYRKVE